MTSDREVVFLLDDVSVSYGEQVAVRDVSMQIKEREITAFIGPSGCGKTTLLRALNRMTDMTPQAYVAGQAMYRGANLYGPDVDPIEIRKRIGMVFQKPNAFPKSIYDNVAYGPRINRLTVDLDDLVEECLIRAALWDEVKDGLGKSALELSGGQAQRLVIARCLAINPDVLLMDEPCASLDPIATAAIEDLMLELAMDVTIVLVTHDLQEAKRVADRTAFFDAEFDERGRRFGRLVEFAPTAELFANPKAGRTQAYVTGTQTA